MVNCKRLKSYGKKNVRATCDSKIVFLIVRWRIPEIAHNGIYGNRSENFRDYVFYVILLINLIQKILHKKN